MNIVSVRLFTRYQELYSCVAHTHTDGQTDRRTDGRQETHNGDIAIHLREAPMYVTNPP